MARSLKERYETRRLETLQERAKAADAQLVLEQRASVLICEAMSEDDLNKVAEIIKKLDSIKSPELPKLSAAIEQATAEVNKYTAGGPIAQAWSKMKEKVGFDNPVVKVTTFANALERGFSQIPTILKNNGVDMGSLKTDLSKSLASTLSSQKSGTAVDNPTGAKGDAGINPPGLDTSKAKTGAKSDAELGNASFSKSAPTKGAKSDEEMGNASYGGSSVFSDDPIGSEMPNKQDEADSVDIKGNGKLRTIVAQLTKALTPSGVFAAFKGVPYIKSADLAQELVQAPLKVFSNVVKRIQSGVKATQLGNDIQSQIKPQGAQEPSTDGGGGDKGTAGSGSTPATGGGTSAAGAPGTSTGTAGRGTQKKPMGPKARAQALKKIIASSGVKDAAAAARFFNYLEDQGMINVDKFTASTPPPSTST